MIYYWVLFAVAAAVAILPLWRPGTARGTAVALALGFGLVLFIGFRFYVGADWNTYEYIFIATNQLDLGTALSFGDPAYYLINWVTGALGGDIWHVNLICAAIFVYGLMRFCGFMPFPGVAFLAAVPYFVIVVAMGYTRQSCAAACIMLAITAFEGRLNPRVIFWLVAALAFHKSAIFLIPVVIMSITRNRIVTILAGAAFVLLLLSVFVLGSLDTLLDLYVEAELQSGGAVVRLALMLVTTVLFFIFLNKRTIIADGRLGLWRNMGFLVIALDIAYLFSPSSTVIDRISILLFPFQTMVFAYLPTVTRNRPILTYPMILAMVGVNFLVLFTWLNYGEYVRYWLPYRNVLFEPFIHVF